MDGYSARLATQADLLQIRDWLEQEHQQHNDGIERSFFCNYNLIEAGQESGSLTALIREADQLPIAFSLGDDNIDILEVKADFRRRGFGRYLAQHIINAALARDVIGMHGECATSISKPFWQSIGFESVVPPDGGDNPNWVALPLPHNHQLRDGQRHSISVALEDDQDQMQAVFQTNAVVNARRFLLAHDFVHYVPLPNQQLEVCCDGDVVFSKKNKYVSEIGGERHAPWVRIRQIDAG